MKQAWILSVVCLLAGGLCAREGIAARTRAFRIEGVRSMVEGRMNGVSVSEDGIVAPGPSARLLLPDGGAQVWCLLAAKDGTVYVGTGSDGAVYRLKGDQVEKAGSLFEYEVFALAEGAGGRIFAAGTPNATVTEILRDGTVSTLFDSPEKLVWSLLADRDGNLFAATGERGKIYRITPRGEGTVFYGAEDSHVLTLAWTAAGKILAGTDGRGLLIEIDPRNGAGRILYDARLPEIGKVVVGPEGEIYFAAAGDGDGESTETPSDGGKGSGAGGEGGAELYALAPDGTVRLLWRCPERMIHSLCLDAQRNILVGTGEKAALYRVTPTGDVTLLWKPEEGQVLALLSQGETILAGTGNPGRVYRLGARTDGEAWIRPEPQDAGNSAAWGRAVWEVLPGAGKWELRTRSGYSERPDSSWNDWSEPLQDAEGSLVASPPGRFLQVEARFTGGDPGKAARLRRIWIPFSEPNLPPRVSSIRLSAEAIPQAKEGSERASFTQDLGGGIQVEYQKAPPGPTGAGEAGPPPWVRDVRSIAWDAEDPNGDPLLFEVALRQVGEEKFRTLTRDHPAPVYALDTATLPDGAYEVRVTASDSPANPPAETMTVERIGGPFRVDHHPPEFVDLKAVRRGKSVLIVEGTVRDESSPLLRFEVSWDGQAWRPMGAADGFLDSREESFRVEIPLEREEEGSWVAARAFDAAGNEAVRRAWLTP